MSQVQQTCPACGWQRGVTLPAGLHPAHAETIAKHVARSLQWEWLAHWEETHETTDSPEYVLISTAFADWVKQETAPTQKTETPPGEGVGYNVGVNLPGITPDQARQLNDAVERTMLSVAEGLQRWAEHAAQAGFTRSLRAIAEGQRPRSTCQCGGVDGHCPGDQGCLFKPNTPDDLLAAQQRWAERFGGDLGYDGRKP